MREFVSKKKKLKVTIDGTSYEMRVPTVEEQEKLDATLNSSDTKDVMGLYKDFFEKLGLPKEVYNKMDADDSLEFIKFVFNPKALGSQP